MTSDDKPVLFFVDMDETLLHGKSTRWNPGDVLEEIKRAQGMYSHKPEMVEGYVLNLQEKYDQMLRAPITKTTTGQEYRVIVRPGAVQFLQKLQGIGVVLLLSAGSEPWVQAATKASGLHRYLHRRYSVDNCPTFNVPEGRTWFLIDNERWGEPNLMNKFRLICGEASHPSTFNHVQVRAFRGGVDNGLSEALSDIGMRLERKASPDVPSINLSALELTEGRLDVGRTASHYKTTAPVDVPMVDFVESVDPVELTELEQWALDQLVEALEAIDDRYMEVHGRPPYMEEILSHVSSLWSIEALEDTYEWRDAGANRQAALDKVASKYQKIPWGPNMLLSTSYKYDDPETLMSELVAMWERELEKWSEALEHSKEVTS